MATTAGLHQHHLGYCMWLLAAMPHQLSALAAQCFVIRSSKETDEMHIDLEHVL